MPRSRLPWAADERLSQGVVLATNPWTSETCGPHVCDNIGIWQSEGGPTHNKCNGPGNTLSVVWRWSDFAGRCQCAGLKVGVVAMQQFLLIAETTERFLRHNCHDFDAFRAEARCWRQRMYTFGKYRVCMNLGQLIGDDDEGGWWCRRCESASRSRCAA